MTTEREGTDPLAARRRHRGYGPAACIVALIYILGLCPAAFLPETAGKPLPEKV